MHRAQKPPKKVGGGGAREKGTGRGGVKGRGNKKRRAKRMAEGRMAWDKKRKNEGGREMRNEAQREEKDRRRI